MFSHRRPKNIWCLLRGSSLFVTWLGPFLHAIYILSKSRFVSVRQNFRGGDLYGVRGAYQWSLLSNHCLQPRLTCSAPYARPILTHDLYTVENMAEILTCVYVSFHVLRSRMINCWKKFENRLEINRKLQIWLIYVLLVICIKAMSILVLNLEVSNVLS